MLKQVRKKKQPTIQFDAPVTGQIACGACRYVRKQSDRCPDWQCPGCGKAYSKVNSTPEAVKQQRRAERKRKQREAQEAKQEEMQNSVGLTGFWVGVATFLKGAGSACVAANPVVQVLGIAIMLGAAIYGLSHFWS